MGNKLNRYDSATAIPLLEKRIDALEKKLEEIVNAINTITETQTSEQTSERSQS